MPLEECLAKVIKSNVFREVDPSNYKNLIDKAYIATHGRPTGMRLRFYFVAT